VQIDGHPQRSSQTGGWASPKVIAAKRSKAHYAESAFDPLDARKAELSQPDSSLKLAFRTAEQRVDLPAATVMP
jgi:hypothetical protein